jgi:hypothetical protein
MNETIRAKIARFILGLDEQLEISGDPIQVAVLSEVIQSSKELYESLNENAQIDQIQESLDRKRLAVERWKNLSNEKWML